MNERQFIETVYRFSPDVEAVAFMSAMGLPLEWHCDGGAALDEIISLAAEIFAMGMELHTGKGGGKACLHVTTAFGDMLVFEMTNRIFLLVLVSRNGRVREIKNFAMASLEEFAMRNAFAFPGGAR